MSSAGTRRSILERPQSTRPGDLQKMNIVDNHSVSSTNNGGRLS